MKLARTILRAVAAIFTILMVPFSTSNNPDDKKWMLYCMIVAISAWGYEVVLLVRGQHRKAQIDLSIAPKGVLEASHTPPPAVHPSLIKTTDVLPPWTEYTQDVFNNISSEVIWRWHYKPDIDNTPRGITPFCPECMEPTKLRVSHRGGEQSKTGTKIQSEWVLSCTSLTHIRLYSMPAKFGPHLEQFPDIKERIQQRLVDGSWVELVNRQRAGKGIAPLSVPPDTKATAPPPPIKLDEIAEQILIILWVHREVAPTSVVDVFVEAFRFFRSQQDKPNVDRALLDHHLTSLVNEYYIHLEIHDMVERYSLISKGQKYFIDNNLRDTELFRSLRTLVDQGAEPAHIDTLDETKTEILIIIALYDSCRISELETALNIKLRDTNKPLLITANIKHHLDQLKEDKFIKIFLHSRRSETYHLDKRGQKFLTDNNLWPKPPTR